MKKLNIQTLLVYGSAITKVCFIYLFINIVGAILHTFLPTLPSFFFATIIVAIASLYVGPLFSLIVAKFVKWNLERQLKKLAKKKVVATDEELDLNIKDLELTDTVVKVYKKDNTTVGIFKLPIKAVETFKDRHPTNAPLTEEEFMNTLSVALNKFEMIFYFARVHNDSMSLIESQSKPLGENHLSAKDSDYYLTYFDNDRIVVLKNINGKRVTKHDVESYRLFMDGKFKYEKADYEKWLTEKYNQ